jgi:hypothetical protein
LRGFEELPVLDQQKDRKNLKEFNFWMGKLRKLKAKLRDCIDDLAFE